MADLKKLQEMAKNGEFSRKLLKDENFINETKKILKEEDGIEATDEQVCEIIENFEKILQNENILKDAELEAVSGGISASKIGKKVTGAAVVGGSAIVSGAVGAVTGAITGAAILGAYGFHLDAVDNEPGAGEAGFVEGGFVGGAAGTLVGLGAGVKIGNEIRKKLKL